MAWTWAFILEPVDPATTRLLIRMRVSYQPVAKWGPYMWLLVEPAHFIMGRRQLRGIRQRAQATRPPGAHQATRAGQLPNLAAMPTISSASVRLATTATDTVARPTISTPLLR